MAGTENPRIPPRTERPQELSHSKIIEGFDPVGVDPSFGAVSAFWQAKTDWEIGLETFRQRMHASISEAWEGNAAEASKAAISAYARKAEELTPTFATVANLISSAALASSDTKSSIPARKPDPRFWHINDRWIDNDEFEDDRSDDEEEARAIMQAKYVKAFATVDAGLPVLDHPTSLVTPNAFIPAGNNNGDDNTGGTGGGGDTSENQQNTDDDNSATPSEDGATTENDTDQNTDDDTSTTEGDDTAQQNTNPAGTESPATTPTTTTPGTGTLNTPGSPGSPSGGSPSSGSPTGGSPGASVPTPGRAVPGVPTAVVPVAAATGSAGAASRGMMGAPGMMGAGVGRGSGNDDENTHETPDYLINEQNTRELLGDIPKVTPQAIGSHFPSAQNRPADNPSESS